MQKSVASPNQQQLEEKRLQAKLRKDRIVQIEFERSKQANQMKAAAPTTSAEVEKYKEQNEDIVKLLNTCKQRAAAFAIRDQQLRDKAIREKEEQDYERMMDLEMEINRLKDIAAREKEEEARVQKLIKDRKVIEDQIKERQHQRLLQEEARDQENKKMLETIKKFEEEDAEKARQKKEHTRRAKLEILKRNEEILKEKEAKKEFDRREEAMIVKYLTEQDEKLRKREEEEAEAQRKKVELQKKLLESQTKALDKRSEIDELRARRAAEEKERQHRQRELEEAQKRKRDREIMHMSRQKQQEERRLKKEQEQEEKRSEYMNALRHAEEMARREHDESELAKIKNAELRQMLQQQIQENENRKKIEEKEKRKEGQALLDKMCQEKEKLGRIRSEMVAEMRAQGVKDNYFMEMQKMDLEKFMQN